MTETIFGQMRKTASTNGGCRVRPEDIDDLREAASNIKVPAVALNQKAWSPVVPVPEVKALSGDRRDRRAAKELRRELAQIATTATKVGVAMQAVRSVCARHGR